jgi:hypothetical protein
LGSQTIDLGPIGTLQNTGYSLSPLAARTGIAAVGIECAAVPNAAGVSPLYSAAFPKPEVTIADWADSAIEIVPNVFFQAMKGMIEQHLPAPLVFSERLSNVGPAPAQYPSPGSFLHLSGDVWCIDDFGDRKDYGLHDLYSGIEWRTTSNPGEIQVYLKSFVLGQVVFGLTLLPDVPLATLQNVDRVETTLGVDLAAISIRYRRN